MQTTLPAADLGVALVGHAFMGTAHSHAWRSAPSFFDLPLNPRRRVLVGRDRARALQVADRFEWESTETDWRAVIGRRGIDLVDICSPSDTHAEIAVAALEAGQHVLCEKPMANTVSEAEQMAKAAAAAAQHGVRAMVGFTYRRVPAVALARRLVREGRLGRLYHVRAQYLQDWLSDPEAPMSWRLDRSHAGSGALGDIGSHIVDMAQFVTGELITTVSGALERFTDSRPLSGAEPQSGPDARGRGTVTVDDAVAFTARTQTGALATFEATRCATGHKNALRIEVNGELGSLWFDLEDLNVLHLFDSTQDDVTGGFRRIMVTEARHPYVGAWWPPGHSLGYEHGFVHQAVDLVCAIAEGRDPAPSFADGLQVQRVLDAVESSARDGHRHEVPSD